MNCAICSWSPNDIDYLLIYEKEYWRIVLAPNQCLLGRSLVDLKRHCSDIAKLSEKELLEWVQIVQEMEEAIKNAFTATMYNLSCYMNTSYQMKPYNPHVHWWIVPRYDHPVIFNKITFEDPDFGNPYNHTRRLELPIDIRKQIIVSILDYLKK
jgi:diadenosine tetraphosphate (Ap4A) HIT family hydrolase